MSHYMRFNYVTASWGGRGAMTCGKWTPHSATFPTVPWSSVGNASVVRS